jgi:hypothetical protein
MCDALGVKLVTKPCGSNQSCKLGKCVGAPCESGQKTCKAGQPYQCNATGDGLVKLPACGAGTICSGGLCQKPCKPNLSMCDGPGLKLTCKANGQGFVGTACGKGQVCSVAKAACVKQVCQPGVNWCDGNVAKTCAASGLAVKASSDCGKVAQVCNQGVCVKKGCGDGACDKKAGESCKTCAKDCGLCKPDGCSELPGAGCQGCACEKCVCALDSSCCANQWSGLCPALCKSGCANTCAN